MVDTKVAPLAKMRTLDGETHAVLRQSKGTLHTRNTKSLKALDFSDHLIILYCMPTSEHLAQISCAYHDAKIILLAWWQSWSAVL